MTLINPFNVEKNLSSWASSRIISRGRDYYRKGNVLQLDSSSEAFIQSKVRGSDTEPYEVQIQFDSCGMPISRCTCPFNWEPLCKHAVSTLIAWMQEETESEPFIGKETSGTNLIPLENPHEKEKYISELEELEIKSRQLRCKEQGLRIVSKPANSCFGEYQVTSGNLDRKNSKYNVVVRDANWKHATCDCLDFLTNELGTCKHIELIKHRIPAKKLLLEDKKNDRIYLYKAVRHSNKNSFSPSEEIRIFIPPKFQDDIHPVIDKSFDESGFLINGRPALIQKKYFQQIYNTLNKKYKDNIDVHNSVWDTINDEINAFKWEKYIDEIAASPQKNSAFQKSVGSLSIKLHPYQMDGIFFAVKKQKAFIGDEMGLGKTMQAIGSALFLKELKKVKRVFIICPASLKFQWKKEIEKVSGVSVEIITGPAKERDLQYKNGKSFFAIINYELLYRDYKQLASLFPDMIILDEAQRIKNWDTKIAKTIKQLHSPFKLVLTGTPLENRLPELLSISEFLHPRALGASWKLIPAYAKTDSQDRIIGYTNLDHLRIRLKKFLIRRQRGEVLKQLPARTDNNYWTPLSAAQSDVHDSIVNRLIKLLKKWKKFKHLTKEDLQLFFMLLTSMRIVSNAYGQYDWKSIEKQLLNARKLTSDLQKKINSPKLEEFRKIIFDLLENPEQKIIIFSGWERMIRLAELYIRDILEEKYCSSLIFSGSVPVSKRPKIVNQFINDPKVRILFSTDSGSVGLNLQEGSNCVINLEMPWNPAVLEQRIGRVYRMGQKKSVQVINLISSECIEERIFNLIAEKKALFEGVFSEDINEINFNQGKTASFMDKMSKMFSKELENENEEEEFDNNEDSKKSDNASAKLIPEDITNDTISDENNKKTDTPDMDVQEINIQPVINQILKNLNMPELPEAASNSNVKIKISEDEHALNLLIPKSVKTLLKGFQPLLKTLLNLSEMS